MLLTLTAKDAEPAVSAVSSTDDIPMLSVATDLFLPAFNLWHFFFRRPTFPKWRQVRVSLLSLVYFFDPLVLISTDWYFVVDACAMNALDSAAVVDVCSCFSIVQFLKQTVRPSLVIIKRLPDIAKFLVLRSHCCQDLPMQQFNHYVFLPRTTSQP